jgi:hypothetical protein
MLRRPLLSLQQLPLLLLFLLIGGAPTKLAANRGPVAAVPPARPGKHIDWYFGGHGPAWLDFGLHSHADLVDGLLPCSNSFAIINCATGRLNVSASWNLSDFGAYLRAGKEVNVQLAGGAACCKSNTSCPILANKEGLARDILALALLYNLTGFTQDWEFGAGFWWDGWNQTMSHVAEVLKPHGIGLGLSINSVCESESLAINADPTCAPASRHAVRMRNPVILSHLYINEYDLFTKTGSGQT